MKITDYPARNGICYIWRRFAMLLKVTIYIPALQTLKLQRSLHKTCNIKIDKGREDCRRKDGGVKDEAEQKKKFKRQDTCDKKYDTGYLLLLLMVNRINSIMIKH